MWMTLNWGLRVDLKERMVRARLDQRNSRVFSWVSTHIFISTKGTLASKAQEWDLQLKMVEVILGGYCGCGREWKMLGKNWKLSISQRAQCPGIRRKQLEQQPHLGSPWWTLGKRKPPSGQGFEQCILLPVCMEREWPGERAYIASCIARGGLDLKGATLEVRRVGGLEKSYEHWLFQIKKVGE